MDEIRNSVLYGTLPVEIPEKCSLADQLEILRALVANPSAQDRINMPKDIHPWVKMLYSNGWR